MNNKPNVAAYIRLSREDKLTAAESMSVSNRRAQLSRFATEKGWSLAKVYIDDGYT